MQVIKRHVRLVLVVVLLVAALVVSLFIAQNVSKPSVTTASLTPTITASSSPSAPGTSATPSASPYPPSMLTGGFTPPPPLPSGLYPGEVTEYDGQQLTSISTFVEDIALHPDVAIDGTQHIDEATYNLTITGLVNQPVEYTYSDILNNFTLYQNVSTLLCVEGWSVTCLWQGVLVSDLIKEAGVSPDANTLIFIAADGYTTSLPLSYVEQNNITLAYKMNNVTLPAAAGFPLALVPPDQYGYKWIKWVTQIDVSNDSSYLGYWESRGYPNNATVPTGSDGAAARSAFTIAETVGVFAVGIVMAVAVYLILVRTRRRNFRKPSSGSSVKAICDLDAIPV